MTLMRSERAALIMIAGGMIVGGALMLVPAGSGDEATFDYASADSLYRAAVATPADSLRFLVDINTAGEEELMQIPGMTRAIARNIVRHREREGRFTRIDELMRVPGIGKGKFETIGTFVTVHSLLNSEE